MSILSTLMIISVFLVGAVTLFTSGPSNLNSIAHIQRLQDADYDESAILDRVKAEYIKTMKKEGIDTVGLRAGLTQALSGGSGFAKPLTTFQSYPEFPDYQRRTVEISDPANHVHYSIVEIHKTRLNRTRRFKINLGYQSVFSNAVTGNDFQCIFCHVQVYGDVAQYHRGGDWRAENDRIHGSLYIPTPFNIAGKSLDTLQVVGNSALHPLLPLQNPRTTPDVWAIAPKDCNSTPRLPSNCTFDTKATTDAKNPPAWWGGNSRGASGYFVVREMHDNYQGPKLPWNVQRQSHLLPKIDPGPLLYLAQGLVKTSALGDSRFKFVPYGSDFSQAQTVSEFTKIVEGNAVLKGTTEHPIEIHGRVFFRGDVIIMGRIKGNGAIYSGRNIYIADDLEYVNPPPEFDGSEESNRKMSTISYCSLENGNACPCGSNSNCLPNAKRLADVWRKHDLDDPTRAYDQLFLFAINNIFVGDPFPYSADILANPSSNAPTPIVPWSESYAVAILRKSYRNQLAFDKATGFMLDCEAQSDGSCLFGYPWEKSSQFSLGDERNPRIHLASESDFGDSRLSDEQRAYLDFRGLGFSAGYRDTFLPKNAIFQPEFNLKPWINASQFRSNTRNIAEIESMEAPDSSGRRGLVHLAIPLFHRKPYDPASWRRGGPQAAWAEETPASPEGAMRTIDRILSVESLSTATVYGSETDNNPRTLAQAVEEFFGTYVEALNRTPDGANIRYNGRTHTTPGIDHPLRIEGNAATNIERVLARFSYDASYCWDAARQRCGRLISSIHYLNKPLSAAYCDDGTDSAKYYIAGTVPACQSRLVTRIASDERDEMDADLRFDINFQFRQGGEHRVIVGTRYWDPAKLPAKNRIRRIDSYLFANHFVFRNSNSLSHNDLRINGGVVARDLLSSFMTNFDRADLPNYSSFYQDSHHYQFRPTRVINAFSQYAGGLLVMVDPRARFDIDLVYSDFGTALPE